MNALASDSGGSCEHGFSHQALFYSGPEEFTERIAAFVREGLGNAEPQLVMVTADKIAMLRDELGAEVDGVRFVDMGETGRNPGRIISAWSDFAADHLADGRPLRGVGEPIWAGRKPAEMVECQHHESLLNLAFDDAHGFRLLCPYDTAALAPEVIAEARRSHPLILAGDSAQENSSYRGIDSIGSPKEGLPVPRTPSLEMGFQQKTLGAVRRFVSDCGREVGLPDDRAEDLVVAVNEAATNSVRHGGGEGVCRVWWDAEALVCEVRDRGRIDEPLVGRRRPTPGADGGRGLWLAHQLCDLVQLRSRRGGTVVRLHMQIALT
jgi:anti-sigma regulatory factor (Ser/Thr protein kinase)